MNQAISNAVWFLLIILSVQNHVVARPNFNHRVKRVSDTHMADMLTKLALLKNKGYIAITLPVAIGQDLNALGRKRRSESRFLETLFNQSEEDQSDPGQRGFREETSEELLQDYEK